MKSSKRSNFHLLIFAFLIIFLLLLPVYLILEYKNKKSSNISVITIPQATPVKVSISNFLPSGFTISFLSTKPGQEANLILEKTSSKIILSEDNNILNDKDGKIFNDLRGENYQSETHYFEIKDLKPETQYFFKIVSGPNLYSFKNGNWVKNGVLEDCFSVKTVKVIADLTKLPSVTNPYGAYSKEQGAFLLCPDGSNNPSNTPCFRPNPILFSLNISEVIVYSQIIEGENKKSSILSCLTGKDNFLGKCLIDLANFYNQDFSNFLVYDPALDKLSIWASGPGIPENSEPFLKPIPEVIADSCFIDPLNCKTAPSGERTIVLNYKTPTVTPLISPSPSIKPEPPISECTIIGDLNCDGKVNEADFSVIFQNWTD